MAWSNSKIFRSMLADSLDNTLAYDFGSDAFAAALYNNTGTPDQNDTTAHNAYNGAAGQWVVANEVTDATNWTAGGRALVSPVLNSATSAVVFFDATDTTGAGNVTLASVFGTLVYDTTLAGKNGACFNYFGGSQSVTAGTFTIVWNANGIFRFTL